MNKDEFIKQFRELFDAEPDDDKVWQATHLNLTPGRLAWADFKEKDVTLTLKRQYHWPIFPDGAFVTSSGLNYLLFEKLDVTHEEVLHRKCKKINFDVGTTGYVNGYGWQIEQHRLNHNEIRDNILRHGTLDLHYRIVIPDGSKYAGQYWARYDWVKLVDET